MSPREQAQDGLRMIQQAILQLVCENGPMQPHEVSDALGLRWQLSDGEESAGIGYHIMLAMADAGQLTKDPGLRPTYSIRPSSTH